MTLVKDNLCEIVRESKNPKYSILFYIQSLDLITWWFCEGGSGDMCLGKADWDG